MNTETENEHYSEMETKIKYREGDLKYWDIKLTFSAVEYHYTVALISNI